MSVKGDLLSTNDFSGESQVPWISWQQVSNNQLGGREMGKDGHQGKLNWNVNVKDITLR